MFPVPTSTGQRDGAILLKTSDGKGVWISHMKRANDKSAIKLPSTSVMPEAVVRALPAIPSPNLYVPFGERPSTFQQVNACRWSLVFWGIFIHCIYQLD